MKVDWQESCEELKHRYLKEVHLQRRTRLQAPWQLSQGKRIQDVGIRPGRPAAAWHSGSGGIDEVDPDAIGVLRRVVWHQTKGKQPYLNRLQQRGLVAKVQLGQFPTVWDAKEWVWCR